MMDKLWEDFVNRVLYDIEDPVLKEFFRLTFYTGAYVIMESIAHAGTVANGKEIVNTLVEELSKFAGLLEAQQAQSNGTTKNSTTH